MLAQPPFAEHTFSRALRSTEQLSLRRVNKHCSALTRADSASHVHAAISVATRERDESMHRFGSRTRPHSTSWMQTARAIRSETDSGPGATLALVTVVVELASGC